MFFLFLMFFLAAILFYVNSRLFMSIRQGEKSGSPSADIKKKKSISIILWILIASLALLSVLYTFYMAIR